MAADKPNILFLCVDSLRVFELLSSNKSGPVTDAYDQLAENGIEFSQMISTSTTTVPCMASIHTGEYPFVHGAATLKGPKIREEVPHFTERLQEEGYETRALVHYPMDSALGFDCGYDEYDIQSFDTSQPEHHVLEPEHMEERIFQISSKLDGMDSPWFYFVHFLEPHLQREVSPGMNSSEYGSNLYQRAISTVDHIIGEVLENVDLDDTVIVYHADHGESNAGVFMESRFSHASPLAGLTKIRYEYDLNDTFDWIERRLNHLRRLGIHERDKFTTVGHGFYPNEFLVRVPFTIAGAGIPDRDQINQQIRQIDIAPTLLELAGIDLDRFDPMGESLLPIIEGGSEQRDAYIMANGPTHWDSEPYEGIRSPPWKYVESGSEFDLYNLEDDPIELSDVGHLHPDIANQFQTQLSNLKPDAPFQSTDLDTNEKAALKEELEHLGYL